MTNEIAKASGGFAGISAMSSEERRFLEKLHEAFDNSHEVKAVKKVKIAQKQKQPTISINDQRPERRTQQRTYIPNTKIYILPERKGARLTLLNISKFSLLCEVNFAEQYYDISNNIQLSLSIKKEDKMINISTIICKVVRMDVINWFDDLSPNSLKIALRFVKMTENECKILHKTVGSYLKQKLS